MTYSSSFEVKTPFLLMKGGKRVSTHATIASVEAALCLVRREHYQDYYAELNFWAIQLLPESWPKGYWLADAEGKKLSSIEWSIYGHSIAFHVNWPWSGDVRPRGYPIDGTGKRAKFRFFRRPQTHHRRKHAYFIAEEGEPILRGRSIARGIPTAWEDLPRRSYQDRNWKKFRRTQWCGEG